MFEVELAKVDRVVVGGGVVVGVVGVVVVWPSPNLTMKGR